MRRRLNRKISKLLALENTVGRLRAGTVQQNQVRTKSGRRTERAYLSQRGAARSNPPGSRAGKRSGANGANST